MPAEEEEEEEEEEGEEAEAEAEAEEEEDDEEEEEEGGCRRSSCGRRRIDSFARKRIEGAPWAPSRRTSWAPLRSSCRRRRIDSFARKWTDSRLNNGFFETMMKQILKHYWMACCRKACLRNPV